MGGHPTYQITITKKTHRPKKAKSSKDNSYECAATPVISIHVLKYAPFVKRRLPLLVKKITLVVV